MKLTLLMIPRFTDQVKIVVYSFEKLAFPKAVFDQLSWTGDSLYTINSLVLFFSFGNILY